MTVDQRIRVLESEQRPTAIRSDVHASEKLDDLPYMLYAANQAWKLFWALACKRFPQLR